MLKDRQAFVERLTGLLPEQRAALPFDDALRAEIEQLVRMKRDGARQRLVRRIARRTEAEVWPPIEAALEGLSAPGHQLRQTEDAAERWRARLLADGDPAVQQLIDAHPGADRGQLRQWLRNAKKGDTPAARRARRALYRAIRDLIGDG